MNQSTILRYLEEHNIPTKNNKTWDHVKLTNTLKNTAYMGIKYFNKSNLVKESVNPFYKPKYGKLKPRDKSEWLPVKVPPIISVELFDKVQERFRKNKESYKKPSQSQLLSNLVKCGICGWSYSPYKRFYRGYKRQNRNVIKRYGVYEKVAYTCGNRLKQKAHSTKIGIVRCTNSETIAHRLEFCVFTIIREIMTDTAKLKNHLIGFKNKITKSDTKLKLEERLKILDQKLSDITKSEKELLDKYARGNMSREEYVSKSRNCDRESNETKKKRNELIKQIPNLHEDDVVEKSIRHYCESIKSELEDATDFYSQRQLLQKYISQIVFTNGEIVMMGFVSIQTKNYEDPEKNPSTDKIEFRIRGKVKMGMKKDKRDNY
ncbi:MAG: recombinase family protein [Candidatus Parcubacteria bacterium]|nr:recombinase family protein [Candidatus Parcubacteria bacterium]